MPVFLFGLGATVLGALLIWGRAIRRSKGARLSQVRPVQIRDLAPGRVQAVNARLGLAPEAAPLETPLGGYACAFYELEIVYEERFNDERRPQLRTLIKDRRSSEALLEDGQGTAGLDLESAEVVGASESRCDTLSEELLGDLRRRYGLKMNQVDPSRLVVLQRHLAVGRQLFVRGRVLAGERRPRFSASAGDSPVLVTTQSQEELSSAVGSSGETQGTCGTILLVTGICAILGSAVKFLAR